MKIKEYLLTHKKVSYLMVAVILVAGYFLISSLTKTTGQTEYALGAVTQGSLTSSISGTGQVSTSDQIEIKPEVSGDLTFVGVSNGQEVKQGSIIAQINNEDASMTVKNAELSLENSKIAYQKALKEYQNQSDSSSISDLKTAYRDGYEVITDTFVDLPDILMDMNDIYYTASHSHYFLDSEVRSSAGDIAIEYKYKAGVTFDQVKDLYNKDFATYRSLSINSDPEKIVSFLNEINGTLEKLSNSLNETYNTIDFINGKLVEKPSQIAVDKNNISSYINKIKTHLSNIQNVLTKIEDAKNSTIDSNLSLKSAELSVSQAEDSLRKAKEALANHSIRASFDGIISDVPVKKGDAVTTNTVLATLITKQKIAEISLNEMDVAKIKNGQNVVLTFDAVENLSIVGKVAEVGLVGTVNQGVVSYKIKIGFDTDDNSVRPGMSVSASIITDAKQDILLVPNSAVKTKNGFSYVEILSDAVLISNKNYTSVFGPVEKEVVVGLSDDNYTEITSGLNEGDQIIIRTIKSSTTSATTSQAPSLLGTGSTRGANAGMPR